MPTPVAAKSPAPAPRAVAVRDVAFDHDDTASRVVIDLGGDVQPQIVSTTDRRAELVLDDVDLPVRLERTLDTSRFSGPIRSVSSFRDPKQPGRVRVVVELAQPSTPTLARVGTTWRWQFASAQPASVAKAARAPRSMPPPVVAGYGASSTPIAQTTVAQVAPQPGGKRKIYHGATIDLDTKDAPIHDLLRAISDVARVNIVIPDDINARVTVRLKRVPWDQALEVILASKGLWYRRDGNLIRVAPRKELDAEDEAEAARRAALAGSEAPDTEVLRLNYANSAEILPKLQAMLSPKGKLEVDERTNSLIIYDVRANRRHIQQLALELDTQTPQISIEARVVEASSNYAREFGIQWGGNASASTQGGNATGLVFPSSIGLAGGADDKNTVTSGVTAVPSDFAVNLPAAGVGNDEGGALGLSLGSVGGNFNINLRLSALEDTGTVRIVSSPKVTVLNNNEATISQGTRIPIQVVSAAGAQTQFVNAELSLVVKPYVSQRDCSIAMDLHVTKNEPDFVHTGSRGDPTILSKEAKTRLLVADGETTVLGGIYTRNTGVSYNKIPYLGDIPVFGWLFKRRRETDNRTELLIFITPKITNKAFLRCQ